MLEQIFVIIGASVVIGMLGVIVLIVLKKLDELMRSWW
jgi:hypothetical protein